VLARFLNGCRDHGTFPLAAERWAGYKLNTIFNIILPVSRAVNLPPKIEIKSTGIRACPQPERRSPKTQMRYQHFIFVADSIAAGIVPRKIYGLRYTSELNNK
jgi:hypothetical protein